MLENVNQKWLVMFLDEGNGEKGQMVKIWEEWRCMLKVGRDMSYCSKEDFLENLERDWDKMWMEWEEEDIAEASKRLGFEWVEEEEEELEEEIEEEELEEEEAE